MKGNKLIIECDCVNDNPPCYEVSVAVESPTIRSSNDLKKTYTAIVRDKIVSVSRLNNRREHQTFNGKSPTQSAVIAVLSLMQEL